MSSVSSIVTETAQALDATTFDKLANRLSGRPQISPLPNAKEVWECEVVVIGGSLGGVSAASHAMQSGAKTCLIELSPWLGGQISSQGVSALDESRSMRARGSFSPSWTDFKQLIQQQVISMPVWTGLSSPQPVSEISSCWVGTLCFPPKAGASAAQQLLDTAAQKAPGSRWQIGTAFKGAEFDPTGREIVAVYAVHRQPRNPGYVPKGRPSQELPSWYSWSSDRVFEKVPIRLQPPRGKHMIVIDATDTGEFVGWAGIPYRLGSEAQATTSELYASRQDNPDCTQAFTFPFAMAILDDRGYSRNVLAQIQSDYARSEHRQQYDLIGFPMFEGASLFKYRRIVSTQYDNPRQGPPAPGDITMINWNRGNDWSFMDPPLILNEEKIAASGQHGNWMGGLSLSSLRHAEEHAMLFGEWLIEKQATPSSPLTYLMGSDAPMGTISGLSMMPYIREGRRILGRPAYGQTQFMVQESDLRRDMSGGRDFGSTVVGLTHYSIDMHGCRYRNSLETGEASSAPVEDESLIRPIQIPLEALIPQGVDNLLIGGKGIAATHIVNAATRVHYGEWAIGGAAGSTAGWLIAQDRPNQPDLLPPDIVTKQLVPQLQQFLQDQGLNLTW
ncbi:MAG: FAD-dependent oxidoreductase [Leptolyngbyaceae cyanobacterium CRU_2_3]|nr:FAD-dependent oxidoreductase [Leptolyngbyaceae cyanobacterium CRU_2_3]